MPEIEPIVVGQKLWFVPWERYLGAPHFLTVERVGRVWIYTKRKQWKIHKETLMVDGGKFASPGKIYRTREEWEETQRDRIAWIRLKDLVDQISRRTLTLKAAQIEQACAILSPSPHPEETCQSTSTQS